MIWRTVGRYICKFSLLASYARHCSSTPRRSSGTLRSSLFAVSTRPSAAEDHARHVDPVRRKCEYCCIEVVAQTDIDIADCVLVDPELAPLGERFEELLYRDEKAGDRRLDGGLDVGVSR